MNKEYIQNDILNWKAFLQLKGSQSKDKRLQKFYAASTYSDETPLSDIEFVALDFETTGLDASVNSIISIGLVPFTLDRIFCKKAQHWYIEAQDKLQENTVVIHHITHSDLKNAPDLEAMLSPLLEQIAGKVVVVHYRNIERHFLDKNLRNLIGEGIIFPVIDTMQIEADIRSEKQSWLSKVLKQESSDSIRLNNSRGRYSLPNYSAHNAVTDALATAELFQAQVQHHLSADTHIKTLWL
ncbi:MAG TPA: 3'-5' exonuclease [Psychromonas hadalis]|nr:3'-5' exonuclease [Psychromonas hadalis]